MEEVSGATVFTIGHGKRTTHELGEALHAAGASKVVDVRRFPGSRRHPHLARASLERTLPELGIGYEWRGDVLGGRRRSAGGRAPSRHVALRVAAFRAFADHMDSASFRAALQRLLDDALDEALAIMCAETLWWRCHRRLIADALSLRGAAVVHVLAPGRTQRHVLHQAARPDDDGAVAYDVGTPVALQVPTPE
jgi:uncharacterized protein (DUF488 family)